VGGEIEIGKLFAHPWKGKKRMQQAESRKEFKGES